MADEKIAPGIVFENSQDKGVMIDFNSATVGGGMFSPFDLNQQPHSSLEIPKNNLPFVTGLLPDHMIDELCKTQNMIEPYVDHQVKVEDGRKIVSYGLSTCGYDLRMAGKYRVISPSTKFGIIDPVQFDDDLLIEKEADEIIIPPHGFMLTRSMEYVRMPRDVFGICMNKSTLARCGLVCGVTPIEAGWEGTITIEFSNTTDLPIRLHKGHGAFQLFFIRMAAEPKISYADRGGKYMHQQEIQNARV